MRPGNLQSIQLLRGMAALLVVVFHLEIVIGKYGAGSFAVGQPPSHGYSGVDLFFVISGVVMTTITSGAFGSPGAAGRFLARRAWRVLPLYWLYTSAVLALMIVAPGMANSSSGEQSILASYLLWPQAELPLLTVGWTLIHEAFFYLVMALFIASIGARMLPWMLGAWALATVAAQAWPAAHSVPWARVMASPLTLEFIAGALIGLYWRRLQPALAMPALVLGMAGFCAALFHLHGTPIDTLSTPWRVACFGAPAALITLGAMAWEGQRKLAAPTPLTLLGDTSYSLYLSHVFVISLMGRLWQWSGVNHSGLHYAGFIVLTLAACIGTGWLSWRLLERPLQRWVQRRGRRQLPPARLYGETA